MIPLGFLRQFDFECIFDVPTLPHPREAPPGRCERDIPRDASPDHILDRASPPILAAHASRRLRARFADRFPFLARGLHGLIGHVEDRQRLLLDMVG